MLSMKMYVEKGKTPINFQKFTHILVFFLQHIEQKSYSTRGNILQDTNM